MSKSKESEIIRLYLNNSTIDSISRNLRISKDEVLDVIFRNPATADIMKKDIERSKQGEFVWAFADSTPGRTKLPEHKKKKPRQVRISDEEMESMGNPSTTEIRERAMNYATIFDIIELLSDIDAIKIPEEWFDFDFSDPFWGKSVGSSESAKLRYLLRNPRLIEKVKEQRSE